MTNKNVSTKIHKHLLASVLVTSLIAIFGLIIYPKLAILSAYPSQPRSLSALIEETEVVVEWMEPETTGESELTRYYVSYYPSSDPSSVVSETLDIRTFRYAIGLSGLDPGTEYTVTVSAANVDGFGEEAITTFETPGSVNPGLPEDCAVDAGDSQVNAVCMSPLDVGDSPIISYTVYYSESSKDNYTSVQVEADKNGGFSTIIEGLSNDIEYKFYFTVENENGRVSEPTDLFMATPVSSGGGGDLSLEISGEPTVTTTSTTATIHWTTNRASSSRVYYGPTESISGATSEFNTTPRVVDHETVITGLVRCTKYWFKSESFDQNGISAESLGGEFQTTGCKGDSSVIVADVKTVTAVSGAIASAKVSSKGIEVVAPPALKNGVDIAISAMKLEQDKVESVVSVPTGKAWVGDNAYSLKALQDEHTEITGNFDKSVEVSIDYVAGDLNGVDASTLKIYHFEDGLGWMPLSGCSNNYNSLNQTGVVTCYTTSFSVFGLFGDPISGGGSSTSGTRYRAQTSPENTQTPEVLPVVDSVVPKNKVFMKDLAFEMIDPDVKDLQEFLNTQGFSVSKTGFGSPGMETEFFGPKTENALIRFQERYKNEILTPSGLSRGTGFFGPITRAFVNALLNK